MKKIVIISNDKTKALIFESRYNYQQMKTTPTDLRTSDMLQKHKEFGRFKQVCHLFNSNNIRHCCNNKILKQNKN